MKSPQYVPFTSALESIISAPLSLFHFQPQPGPPLTYSPTRLLMKTDVNLISRIENSAGRTRLVGWQFAADGEWDSAERIFFENLPIQEATQIRHWLDRQVTDNIAFEALLELESGERFFFGVRLSHIGLQEIADTIQGLLAVCYEGSSLSEVVCNVRTALKNQQLATGTPEYLELGVLDLWIKVKPLVVWNKTAPIIAPDGLSLRTKKPDEGYAALHEPQAWPLMLEAAWENSTETGDNFQCWVGLPVSEFGRVPEKYTISKDRYLSTAAVFIGGRPL
jgi:hypothetical protein